MSGSDKRPSRKPIAERMRPGDTCPSCGAATVFEGVEHCSHGGAVIIDGCITCSSVWERETRVNPAVEPCSNCAWLAGSPEFESGALYGIIASTIDGDGIFYCHRRVPFELKEGKRFLHQMDEQRSRCTNARVCAGWIRAKLSDKRGSAVSFEVSA